MEVIFNFFLDFEQHIYAVSFVIMIVAFTFNNMASQTQKVIFVITYVTVLCTCLINGLVKGF